MHCEHCGYNGSKLDDDFMRAGLELDDKDKEIERLKERVNELANVLDDFDRVIFKTDLSSE